MESKYLKRVIEILDENYYISKDQDGNLIYYGWEVHDAMCQLAEEVELESNKQCSEITLEMMINQARSLYTKEQVEELLQKQRELCSIKAKFRRITSKDSLGRRNVIRLINKDSILNAKLKI